MDRIAALLSLVLFAALPALGQGSQPTQQAQTAPPDSPTLQAILTELRSIHNDVRLGQTTQILLTELELQENAVMRATQHRDDLRQRLSQVQSTEKFMTEQLSQFEDQTKQTIDPVQLKQLTDRQTQIKSQLTSLTQQEKDQTNDLLDADTALRKEQDTLQNIQDQLDTVVKKLQPMAGQ